MAQRRLKVVAPQGYPWQFNGPRQSRHEIRRERFVPFNKIIDGMDGATIFNPFRVATSDLIHTFNRIPFNRKKFIIGFESHLPRTFGFNHPAYERFMWKKLLHDECFQIFPISKYALNIFTGQIKRKGLDEVDSEKLLAKTTVRYPNIPIPAFYDKAATDELVITFVGGHFARKGGLVVLRVAEECNRRNLPVKFNIISKLEYGGRIWTDPTRLEFFDKYLKLLDLPNVKRIGKAQNNIVNQMLKESDLSILPTFADTFGFSAVEAMAHGTPVIATAQGALPEFISHQETGFLVSAATTPGSKGWEPDFFSRGTPEFESMFVSSIEKMAGETLAIIEQLLDNKQILRDMRHATYNACKAIFSADDASEYWDRVYERAAG